MHLTTPQQRFLTPNTVAVETTTKKEKKKQQPIYAYNKKNIYIFSNVKPQTIPFLPYTNAETSLQFSSPATPLKHLYVFTFNYSNTSS